MKNRTGHSKRVCDTGPVAPRALRWALPFALVLFAWATPDAGRGDEPELPDSGTFTRSGPHLDTIPAVRQPFKAGESLRFSVQYGPVHAGSAWLEVPEVTEWRGHPSWRLVARAESNSFFDKMYKVRNRIESLWDQDKRFSWRYFENRREGKFTARDTIVFDSDSMHMVYNNGQSYPVSRPVQDALSSFYMTRFQALPVGGVIRFDYHASRKTAPMEVRVLKRERVKTPAGRFDCIVVEPMLKAGGIFKNKGRLVIWLTDDDRRMPVLMKSKVTIGSVKVVLQEAKMGTG